MNNEPVAWMKLDEVLEHFKSVGCGTVYKTGGEGRVPVYTHPVKELTDEEILNLWWDSDHTKDEDDLILTFVKRILKER